MRKIVAAVDEDFGIGKNGDIPWNYPNDLKFFKFITSGGQVVFGRKTFENIGVPLPERETYVFSKKEDNRVLNKDPYLKYTDEEEFNLVDEDNFRDTYICGGESIYSLFLPSVDEIILTRIPGNYNCDTFLVDFREDFERIVEFDMDQDLIVQKWIKNDR